jgi:ligand-binding sensor domain-containing protein
MIIPNLKSIKQIALSVFVWLSLAVSFSAKAQKSSDFMFDTYLIKDGMAQSSPLSIYQDKVGYLWVGTQAGVDRFDGYSFKQYTHDLKNDDTRSSGWVLGITEDNEGNIWTVDNYGHFSFLNKATDKWTNYKLPVRDSIFKANTKLPFYYGSPISIVVDSKTKKVWLATIATGLVSYDMNTKKFDQFFVFPARKNGYEETITKVSPFTEGKLLVATSIGVQYFDTKEHRFSKVINATDSMFNTQANDLKVIGSTLYVATKYGAYIYNTVSKALRVYKNEQGNAKTIASNNVSSIHYSKKNNYLWLTITGEGIDIINLSNNQIVHLNKTNAKDNGISESNYADILEDKDENIWIGSAISGLLKYDPGKKIFGLINKNFPIDFNLGIASTWGMMVDSKGIIWLGEYESAGGVMEVDRVKKTKKRHLKNANGTTLRSWKLIEDYKGNIFAFTGGSVNTFTAYFKQHDKAEFKKLGLMNELLELSPESVNGASFINGNKELILTGPRPIILSDSNGKLVFKFYDLPKALSGGIGTVQYISSFERYVINEEGIYLWNEKTGIVKPLTKNIQFKRGKDLISGPTLKVVDGKMAFVATYGNGLIKVDLEKQTKTFLTLKDGIPNVFLYDIHAGKDNTLWISSNYGLIRYNPYTNKFRSFGPAEGVQDYEFNTNSSFQKPDGEIFFNGVAGLNFFYPDAIKENTTPPNVIIQKVTTKDTTLYIESTKAKTAFVVEYHNNNLAFDFVAFNFRDAAKNKYAYKMEGYDDDWIYAETRRFASYTNLREGTYTFKVKAANSDGVWNEEGASMVIKILPPIWRTWWAYLLYVIAIGGFAFAFIKFRERKQLKKLEDERKNGELAEAKALQDKLLPKVLPNLPHLDIATYLRTSTEVGGDYYDFFLQEDGSLYAVCGDATGHGMPSGMLVSITKAGIIGLPKLEPNNMLSALNRVVKKVDLGILRMSLNIAYINGSELTLSSAGMPPYFIYRASSGDTEEIMIAGIPLGSFNNANYDQVKTSFNKGDILVIISDGLPEAPNATGDLFDYPKVQSIINNNSTLSAQEMIAHLMKEADAWLAGQHNPDDITLVVIKHK